MSGVEPGCSIHEYTGAADFFFFFFFVVRCAQECSFYFSVLQYHARCFNNVTRSFGEVGAWLEEHMCYSRVRLMSTVGKMVQSDV